MRSIIFVQCDTSVCTQSRQWAWLSKDVSFGCCLVNALGSYDSGNGEDGIVAETGHGLPIKCGADYARFAAVSLCQ